MDDKKIHRWAARFVEDLSVAGERIPLERVIEWHIDAFHHLRTAGLAWPAIARILAKAGARREDGHPISADHLRADVSRLSRRKRAKEGSLLPSARFPKRTSSSAPCPFAQAVRRNLIRPVEATQSTHLAQPAGPLGDKTVSEAEIALALTKIKS